MEQQSKLPEDMRPWNAAVASVLAAAEEQGFKIIGVTGDRAGVGVSLLCRELGRAYAHSGMPALVVDASHLELADDAPENAGDASFDLIGASSKSASGTLVVNLMDHSGLLPSGRQAVKELFARAAQRDVTIIVDLPAVRGRSDDAARTLGVIGAACECVFMVCLSGDTTRADLSEAISSCKINRIPVMAIIINDWKEPAAWIASDR